MLSTEVVKAGRPDHGQAWEEETILRRHTGAGSTSSAAAVGPLPSKLRLVGSGKPLQKPPDKPFGFEILVGLILKDAPAIAAAEMIFPPLV